MACGPTELYPVLFIIFRRSRITAQFKKKKKMSLCNRALKQYILPSTELQCGITVIFLFYLFIHLLIFFFSSTRKLAYAFWITNAIKCYNHFLYSFNHVFIILPNVMFIAFMKQCALIRHNVFVCAKSLCPTVCIVALALYSCNLKSLSNDYRNISPWWVGQWHWYR